MKNKDTQLLEEAYANINKRLNENKNSIPFVIKELIDRITITIFGSKNLNQDIDINAKKHFRDVLEKAVIEASTEREGHEFKRPVSKSTWRDQIQQSIEDGTI